MQRIRQERVRELLKRELGEILRRNIPVAVGGVVSVNDVGLAGDMQSAKVFISIVGSPEQKKLGADLLKAKRGDIQAQLGHAVVLRYTPHLTFVLDDSIERGDRVLRILDEIEHQLPDDPGSATPSGDGKSA